MRECVVRRFGAGWFAGGLLAIVAVIGLVACGGGGGGGTSGPSPVHFVTGQAAAFVIGQPDAKSNAAVTGQAGMWFPYDVAAINGALYVAEMVNNRVVGFNALPTADGASADFVLGQPDFVTKTAGTGLDQMSAPTGLAVADGKLFVIERNNGRVLVFEPVPNAAGSAPAVATPAPSFAITGVGTGGLSFSYKVAVGGGKLVISDSKNNRVLIWNTVPSSDVAPDLVLGQPDLSTITANTGGLSGASLSYPVGVWTDGTRLLVGDVYNQRVLVWNTFPSTNMQPADLVLGQVDFTSGSAVVPMSAATMSSPTSFWVEHNQLFIGDSGGSRVLIWNSWPKSNGKAADVVLGQPSADAVDTSGPSASLLTTSAGLCLIGKQLFVADTGNNRVVVFNGH